MHYLDYNEQRQHGTIDFPVGFYRVDEHHPRYNMPFHWHMELEIIRILEGFLNLKMDDEEITAGPGDILFINEGVIHGGKPENCIYECVVFDMKSLLMHTEACKQYIRPISRHSITVKNHFTREYQSFCQTADRLFKTQRKSCSGYELTTVGVLYELFGMIYQKKLYDAADPQPGRNPQKMAHLKPVLEYIESNYSSPVTLEDLSRIAGMSPKYFCRYFQSAIHRTPMDYLNYYRIERACFELCTTDSSVTETAYSCGFNDTSYFIKTFKRYKGVTPRHYSLEVG